MLLATTAVVFYLAGTAWAGTVQATLTATPASYRGACPVTVRFSGSITAAGVSSVQYRIVRSDGTLGPVTNLNFPPEGGTHAVNGTWQIKRDMRGSESIQVVGPVRLVSNPATFIATCTNVPEASGGRGAAAHSGK